MLSRHPSQASLVSHAERLIVASKLSLQKPCQFCGQDYQRKDAHLRTCVGIFQGVYLYLRVARGRAPQELDDGSFDCHGGGKAKAKLERGHQGAPVAAKPRPSGDDRHSPQGNCGMVRRTDDAQLRFPSLQVPQGRGQNNGPKVGQRGRARGSGPAWKGQDARSQRQPQDTWTEDVEEEPEDLGDLKTMVKLLTALVLRHESQHCINRLDTGFVIFLQVTFRTVWQSAPTGWRNDGMR